jgi:hypothetical protein
MVWRHIGLPAASTPAGFSLVGIGGSSAFVMVDAVLEFRRTDGVPNRVRGRLAAFT